MFAPFLTPPYLPFAIAFVVMIGIGLIEAIGLGLGGELPILIWLTSLLGCFTLAGVAIQQGTTALAGAPLPWVPAAGAALLAGLLLNTLAANGLARVMPGFETSAISTDELLRRRGTILEGTARRGAPARARVVDGHGQAHVVMVEPHDAADMLRAGETALLVRREGALFFALPERIDRRPRRRVESPPAAAGKLSRATDAFLKRKTAEFSNAKHAAQWRTTIGSPTRPGTMFV